MVKASGYELDTIASAESGRAVLAAGIIAAEKLNNVPLGLRLLTAAEKADVSPSRGDTLTCQISKEVSVGREERRRGGEGRSREGEERGGVEMVSERAIAKLLLTRPSLPPPLLPPH